MRKKYFRIIGVVVVFALCYFSPIVANAYD